ncbi:response regulator transcription factor [Endozoicomonas arenosclerae]|uniref:response regulator transcription factor n=1 Tax=Endozoicomonas arenosclerae TaxID=1633495 RepID=UPI000784D958|nr:response regulator transcription factor [Endozoicomonas arenosclerae]
MRVLLVEDSREIAGVILDYFESTGHEVDYAADGKNGLSLACENTYDIIILDVMLPGMDGFRVCRELRTSGVSTPVLMLTARDTTDDTLQGFSEGADDYLIKPFDLKILDARVNALVRRSSPSVFKKQLIYGGLSLDVASHSAIREGQPIGLNPTCFKILKILMDKAPEVVTRDELIYAIWRDDPPEGDTLRNHIYQLRTSVDKPFEQALILTVPKVGYRLKGST